jgi:hypothetical protein
VHNDFDTWGEKLAQHGLPPDFHAYDVIHDKICEEFCDTLGITFPKVTMGITAHYFTNEITLLHLGGAELSIAYNWKAEELFRTTYFFKDLNAQGHDLIDEGLLTVYESSDRDDGEERYGLIDIQGYIVIEVKYTTIVTNWSATHVIAEREGIWNLLNLDGSKAVEQDFDWIDPVQHLRGYDYLKVYLNYAEQKDGWIPYVGVIDYLGNYVIPTVFKAVSFHGTTIEVWSDFEKTRLTDIFYMLDYDARIFKWTIRDGTIEVTGVEYVDLLIRFEGMDN